MQVELSKGTILSNRFQIDKVLGIGGFGITYLGHHVDLGYKCAIKEYFISGKCVRQADGLTIGYQGLSEERFSKYRSKFLDEARTLVKVKNRHVVSVMDVFEENGTAYIIMEFIEGMTLQEKVRQLGPLDYPLAVNYIAQLSEAVACCHQHHILHRDIKPDNIMITPDDRVVLIDFGSARDFVNDEVQHHTAILTKGYAPIEQYTSTSKKGNYTDIYSLGGVLYYVVTGEKPMDATDRMLSEMPSPKTLNPNLPVDAERTIMKAMQMQPEHRYQNVGEFMDDLLGKNPTVDVPQEKVVTHPNPTQAPQAKSPNKKVLLISAISALAVVLVGIIIGICIPKKKSVIEPIPGYPMVWVEGGKFIRGNASAKPDEDNYTTNKDFIEISGFYMGKFEVSQEVWESVMGARNNPSSFDDNKKNPVEDVSYEEAIKFINKANSKYASKLRGMKLSLPTEAEWEYAAGGGKKAKVKSSYSGFQLDGFAWYEDNSNGQTHPVGSLQPNRLGLYDMTGNVCEWCKDYYSEDFYKRSSKKDPENTKNAHLGRVYRGGCFDDEKDNLKITYRDFLDEDDSDETIGFRLVLK